MKKNNLKKKMEIMFKIGLNNKQSNILFNTKNRSRIYGI